VLAVALDFNVEGGVIVVAIYDVEEGVWEVAGIEGDGAFGLVEGAAVEGSLVAFGFPVLDFLCTEVFFGEGEGWGDGFDVGVGGEEIGVSLEGDGLGGGVEPDVVLSEGFAVFGEEVEGAGAVGGVELALRGVGEVDVGNETSLPYDCGLGVDGGEVSGVGGVVGLGAVLCDEHGDDAIGDGDFEEWDAGGGFCVTLAGEDVGKGLGGGGSGEVVGEFSEEEFVPESVGRKGGLGVDGDSNSAAGALAFLAAELVFGGFVPGEDLSIQ